MEGNHQDARLRIKFYEWITDRDSDVHFLSGRKGPMFYRWLPDGRSDSVTLETDTDAKLELWLERRGYVDELALGGDAIQFDPDRKEIDESLMRRQAPLNAGGPLFGMSLFPSISEEQERALRNDDRGSEAYEDLGEHVVRSIYFPLNAFINCIRLNLGQYWIRPVSEPPLPELDGGEVSLGAYCYDRGMHWSLHYEGEWTEFLPFVPNEREGPTTSFEARIIGGKEEFISQDDWENLSDTVEENKDYNRDLSVAAEVLLVARELAEAGKIRHALLEGYASLELAVEAFVERKSEGLTADLRQAATNPLSNGLPLKSQVALLLTDTDIPSDELEGTIQAIKYRNQIAHEGGWTRNEYIEPEAAFHSLKKTVSYMLPQSPIRFPEKNPGIEFFNYEEGDE